MFQFKFGKCSYIYILNAWNTLKRLLKFAIENQAPTNSEVVRLHTRLYNNVNGTHAVIGRCPLSIRVQTHGWCHYLRMPMLRGIFTQLSSCVIAMRSETHCFAKCLAIILLWATKEEIECNFSINDCLLTPLIVPLYANWLIECLFFTFDCQKMLMIFFWCYWLSIARV